MGAPEFFSVALEVLPLQGERAVPLDDEHAHSLREGVLGGQQSVQNSGPQVRPGAGRVLLAGVHQELAPWAQVDQRFTAVQHAHSGDPRVREQQHVATLSSPDECVPQ
jgi:hypothetical protein